MNTLTSEWTHRRHAAHEAAVAAQEAAAAAATAVAAVATKKKAAKAKAPTKKQKQGTVQQTMKRARRFQIFSGRLHPNRVNKRA